MSTFVFLRQCPFCQYLEDSYHVDYQISWHLLCCSRLKYVSEMLLVVGLIAYELLTSQRPTPQATTDLLVQSKEQFMKSDESAFSIVPSRLSSRISLSTDGIGLRDSIGSHASMVYRRLSFEDALFTARVYKRNYRTPHLQSLSTRYARNKISTVSLPNDGRYYNEAIAKFKLKLQRSSEGSTTTAISSETMKPNADEEEAEGLDLKSITVKTSHSVSSEEIDTNLENRVGLSTFGWDGLYVRLVDNLEHRISLVAPDSYVKLVKACGRGDNNSVKRQLATTPVISSEDRQTSGLLGSYISGSLYFCPIHATVFNGHVEVMRTLLRRAELENDTGPVVEKAIGGTKDDSWLPLHVAAMKGNLQMVQLLLCNGASVNGKTGFGIQAIHLAARFGSVEILAALIDVGADVNCTDQEGHQPLQYVSQSHGRSRVILYLAMREEIATRCHSSDEPTALQLARYTVFNSSSLPFSLDIGSFYFEICFKARRELSQIASGRQGLGQTGSNADKMMTLHALVVDLYSGAFRDRSDFKRMLELFLDKIDLLAKDTSGATVLDRFFDLWVQIDHLVLSDLEVLFLQSLPENKDSERHVLSRKVNEMRSNATYDVRSKG